MTKTQALEKLIKGRGAQLNTPDPYANLSKGITRPDQEDLDMGAHTKSKYLMVHPKTIVNEVKSPDVGMEYSINPYQGCEHGCIYCYARNTHPYWGYSAGLDFESKILVKLNAAELLRQHLRNPRWRATPIVLSGNTDCYQPAEQKFKLTRSLLQVFHEFRHPVGIITKNALVQRDTEILVELQKDQLVKVIISVTTLDDQLRQKMEPRTASIKKRLQTIAHLAKEGIPVSVMVAPVIPGINEHEIMEIIRICSLMGAQSAGYAIARLNGDVATIFADWLTLAFPDRKDKVLNKISDCHGGKLSDSRFGTRMKGEGKIAESIKNQFHLAVTKFMGNQDPVKLNTDLYSNNRSPQLQMDF
ncbi:MAG: PA0069 family radical SAM protein [Saprospiraceae bacterium]|nr:PA0069 family radical SAM protein [Saprospiraceae bacterium]